MRKIIYTAFVATIVLLGCKKGEKRNSELTDWNFKMGEYLYGRKVDDSAFYFFKLVANTSTDSLQKGMAYNYLGLIQLGFGDYNYAQENFLLSLNALDTTNSVHDTVVSSDYNSLANATLELKEYDSAIRYYDLAIKFAPEKEQQLLILNNKAVLYKRLGDYKTAIYLLDSALKQNIQDTNSIARTLSNFAFFKWLKDSTYIANNQLHVALGLRLASNNKLGQMTSYGHLSDYHSSLRPDSGFLYANKMWVLAQTEGSPDDKMESLDKLIPLSTSSDSIIHYHLIYKKINDSLQTARTVAKNQHALLRYNVSKFELQIEKERKQNVKQRSITKGIIIGASILICMLVLYFRARRRRLRIESENKIRESKLKTSQRVHDVVANGLYGIMNELEHREDIDKEPLLNKIEVLYEQSRDISYEDGPDGSADYDQQIQQLLVTFSNEHTELIIVGNQPAFWNNISPSQRTHLKLILQELMVNMQKHSQAANVVLQFKQEKGTGFIHYKDDGRGFQSNAEFGNGLNNTVSRIKSLNGQVNFEKNSGKGVSIEISFPLEHFNHD